MFPDCCSTDFNLAAILCSGCFLGHSGYPLFLCIVECMADSKELPKRLALLDGQGLSGRGARTRTSASERSGQGSQVGSEQLAASIEYKPCHRKCALCTHHDDDWDPVDLHLGKKVFMWWGKPCSPKGETVGAYCGYCVKVFCAKFRLIGSTTISSYGQQLDERKLNLHISMVKLTVKSMVDKGGNRKAHVDWDGIQERGFRERDVNIEGSLQPIIMLTSRQGHQGSRC